MAELVNVLMQHTVNGRHVTCHIPIPGEVSVEKSFFCAEGELLGHGTIASHVLPDPKQQQPDLEGGKMGKQLMNIAEDRREELALTHAGD